MDYMDKLCLQFIEMYFAAYKFYPANITIDKYMKSTPDMRLASRMKLQTAVNNR